MSELYEDSLASVVADAIREDRRQLVWTDHLIACVQPQTTACAILRLGGFNALTIAQRNDGQCWCHIDIGGFGGGVFVAGDLAEAKRVAIPLLTAKLACALAELREATGQ